QAIAICGGSKAIDILALEASSCCWLLEVKDYRQHRRTKTINISDEIAAKVRDTLAALAGAQHHANDQEEKNMARRALRSGSIRVVLHLEQPTKSSKLFPRAIEPVDVTQRLKQLLKPIDPHPKVVELSSMAGIPWEVSSL
ncbi:MAG TPA: hypothetical protein PLX97_02220, partial [Gemmatales bacterium]|nr:hypothetical protein [Gemmatales bacterium]